jgi:putative membrane protein
MEKTIRAIGVGLALALSACGQDEPPKTPEPAMAPQPFAPTVNQTDDNGASSAHDAGISPVADLNGAASRDAAIAIGLTNGQIIEVTRTANVGEIEQAHLAHKKSKDPRVQKLAAMMIRDHVEAQTKGDALARKAELNPEKSPVSESLENEAKGATQTLKAESGLEFDKAYVDMQVREHQEVLDTINDKLIPCSTNLELSAYLHDVQASVATHLEHARELQRELAGSERRSAK